MTLAARLTALGFAAGSLAHATGGVLLLVGITLWPYAADYPVWRHAAFAAVDALIAWISVRHQRWRVFPLAAFWAQQAWAHGLTLIVALVLMAVLCAAWERWKTAVPMPAS